MIIKPPLSDPNIRHLYTDITVQSEGAIRSKILKVKFGEFLIFAILLLPTMITQFMYIIGPLKEWIEQHNAASYMYIEPVYVLSDGYRFPTAIPGFDNLLDWLTRLLIYPFVKNTTMPSYRHFEFEGFQILPYDLTWLEKMLQQASIFRLSVQCQMANFLMYNKVILTSLKNGSFESFSNDLVDYQIRIIKFSSVIRMYLR